MNGIPAMPLATAVAAEALGGKEILVPANVRPELATQEIHLMDLVGLEASRKVDGPNVCTVGELIDGGNVPQEMTTSKGRKLLIPIVEAIVSQMQMEGCWLLLTPQSALPKP